jgi:hypothetical protein
MRSSFRRHSDGVASGPRSPATNGTRRAAALELARAIAPVLSELGGMSARAAAAHQRCGPRAFRGARDWDSFASRPALASFGRRLRAGPGLARVGGRHAATTSAG